LLPSPLKHPKKDQQGTTDLISCVSRSPAFFASSSNRFLALPIASLEVAEESAHFGAFAPGISAAAVATRLGMAKKLRFG